MLIRLILLAVVVMAALYGVYVLRGHPLERVRGRWRDAARDSALLREILAIRRHIARMAVKGQSPYARVLLEEADPVIEGVVDLAERVRELSAAIAGEAGDGHPVPALEERRKEIEAQLLSVRDWMSKAHERLVASAVDDFQDTVGYLQDDLRGRTTGLATLVESMEQTDRELRPTRKPETEG